MQLGHSLTLLGIEEQTALVICLVAFNMGALWGDVCHPGSMAKMFSRMRHDETAGIWAQFSILWGCLNAVKATFSFCSEVHGGWGFRRLRKFNVLMQKPRKALKSKSENVGKLLKYQPLSYCRTIFSLAPAGAPRLQSACDREVLSVPSQFFLGLQYQTQSNIFSSRLCH